MSSAQSVMPMHKEIAGIHFLKLRGTSTERAAQHGTLLREQIQAGAMRALARKNEWLIRTAPGLMQHRAFQESAVWLYRRILLPFLMNRNRANTGRLRALAQAAGIPYDVCLASALQPDALMLVSRLSVIKHLLKDIPSSGLPGCTSAVALGSWTKAGRMLVCRNLDYPVVGPWEQHTTVAFNYPTDRGEMPHISVTTAGAAVSGLTSINAEGLTLATHAHFGSEVSLRGRDIVNIGDEIISRAGSIEQAVDIARKHRRIGNWAFVISSARERSAAVIEMTPSQTRVRYPEDGFIAHTNYFQTDLSKEEGLVSGGSYEDMVGRVCRIRQIFEKDRGSLNVSHMAAALGDHIDPQTGQERVVGNIVSVVTTIGSTVFEPESLRLWVSNRKESPTGLGEFVEISMDSFWKETEERSPKVISGYKPNNAELVEGVKTYREAYRAWHMENHVPGYQERALTALKKTLEIFPSDGCIWVQTGIVAFSLKRFSEARHYFVEAGKRPLTQHAGNVRELFLARCQDVQGERESALSLYGKYATIRDPKLRKAMREGLKRRYRVSDTVRLMLDLQFADALQY